MGPNGVPISDGRPDQTEALNQIVSQLRDHLEHTAHVERMRDEQVVRTKDLKPNVIIRIDKKERKRTMSRQKPREQEPSNFDISRISQCCAPLSGRTTSYETPLTNASTNSVAEADSRSFLQSGTSDSMLTKDAISASASSHKLEPAASEGVTFDDEEEKEKELLRLKSDILSTCSSAAGDGSISTYGHSTIVDDNTDTFTIDEASTIGETSTIDDNYSLESTYEFTVQRPYYPAEVADKHGKLVQEEKTFAADHDASRNDRREDRDEASEARETKRMNLPSKDSLEKSGRSDKSGRSRMNLPSKDSLEKSGRSDKSGRSRVGGKISIASSMQSLVVNTQESEGRSKVSSDRDSRSLLKSSSAFSHHDAQAGVKEIDSKSASKRSRGTFKISPDDTMITKDIQRSSQAEKFLSGSDSKVDENALFKDTSVCSPSASVDELDDDETTFEISYDEGMGVIFDEEDAASRANSKVTDTPSVDDASEEMPAISIDDGSISRSDEIKQSMMMETRNVLRVEDQRPPRNQERAVLPPRKEERDVLLDKMQDITCENPVIANDANGELEDATAAPFLVASATLSDMSEDEIDTIGEPCSVVKRVPFIHGSYTATAPFFIHDLKWKRILRKLMPRAHAKVVALLKDAGTLSESSQVAQMMKWAENNPVVAAYGIITNDYAQPRPDPSTPIASNGYRHAQELAHVLAPPKRPSVAQPMPPIEWNVFLDPLIVADLEKAMDQSSRFRRVTDQEVERHVNRLVKRLILSHGTPHQLLSEAMGVYRSFTFAALAQAAGSESAERSKSRIGSYSYTDENEKKMLGVDGSNAIFVTQWLARFASAIHLGAKPQNKSIHTKKEEDSISQALSFLDNTQSVGQPYCGMLLCVGFEDENSLYTDDSDSSFGVSAKAISKHIGGSLRVALNLKSRNISPRVWAHLVDFMRKNGVWVESIISFDADEIRDIADLVEKPLKQFRMFHSAGDLQAACHNGEVENGDNVFFNAASLLATDQDKIAALVCGADLPIDEVAFADYAYPKSAMSSQERGCMATLEDYKRKYRLNVGCYVQEHTVSAATVDVLIEFVNQYSTVYNLGFAYGGVNGRVAIGLKGDGFSKQRFMGREWDDDAKPLSSMRMYNPWHSQIVNKISRAGGWGQLGTLNDGGA